MARSKKTDCTALSNIHILTMPQIKTESKKRKPQSRYFVAVAQLHIPEQMDVVRWLLSDVQYEVAAIVHDRDIGKKPHVHLLLRVPKKMQADTLSKRFGKYLHFGVCKDPYEYARYLTHSTFNSRNKFQYQRSDIMGNQDFYNEMLHDAAECLRFADTWSGLLAEYDGNMQDAFEAAVTRGYHDLVKSIMAHGYFYEKYFRVNHTVKQIVFDYEGQVISQTVTEKI